MVALRFGVFVPQGWRLDPAEIADPVARFESMTAEEFNTAYWVGNSDENAERLRPVIDAGADYIFFYIPRLAYDHGSLQQVIQEITPQLT